jgi:hypothetical protein
MANSDHDELFRAATVGLITAFVVAKQNLAKALNQSLPCDEDIAQLNSIEDERERQAMVLMIAGEFFATTLGKPFANKYFFEPASAFADLNNGVVRPQMEPSLPGNRADPSNRWRGRARVAVALEARMRADLSQKQAEVARTIVREYPDLVTLAGENAGRDFGATIIGWRNEFRAGRIKNFEAEELFAFGVERIDKLAGDIDGLKALADEQLRAADQPTL